jgi:NADP-dependent 3-hydroxy acid dehydrogenase YdfG
MVLEKGAICSAHVVDVADRVAVEAFATDVYREHGAVHLVINNAGVTLVDQAELVTYEDLNWVMNINFWGTKRISSTCPACSVLWPCRCSRHTTLRSLR